jgi:hypothetical protein
METKPPPSPPQEPAEPVIVPPPPGPPPGPPAEIGGRTGPDPTRYGDWELNGRCIDF